MTDKLDDLIAECAKEQAICEGANPSKYHKERFESLKKQVKDATPKPKKEEAKKQEPETVVSNRAS